MTIKLVINIVKVPYIDFFCLKIIQLLEWKFFPINPANPSPKVIIKNPATSERGSVSQKRKIRITSKGIEGTSYTSKDRGQDNRSQKMKDTTPISYRARG